MDIATDVLETIAEIVTEVAAIFVELFSQDGIISVFWDDSDGLTFLGVLALIVIGFSLVRWAFRFILRMLRMQG